MEESLIFSLLCNNERFMIKICNEGADKISCIALRETRITGIFYS